MGKLKIPGKFKQKFSLHSLVDTSDTAVLSATEVDPDTETVSLADNDQVDDDNQNSGCIGWMRSQWYYKAEREKRNHANIVAQIGTIGQKIDHHEATLVDIEQNLKKCKKTKNKHKARLFLLKRKRLMNTIQSYYNTRAELEQVLISLEESSDQVALVKSYKTANKILKTTMRQNGGQSNVEVYEDLANDLQEAQDDVNERQEAVSRNTIGKGDDELQEELDLLFDENPSAAGGNPPPHQKIMIQSQIEQNMLDSLPSVPLPVAPVGEVVMSDEDAIKELEYPMAS